MSVIKNGEEVFKKVVLKPLQKGISEGVQGAVLATALRITDSVGSGHLTEVCCDRASNES